MLLEEGRIIRDVYEIDRFLGEGAFAEVYRVKHKFLGRQAMKVFKSPSLSLQEVEQKLGEAVILSRIGHPNIIRVFDAGILDTKAGNCGYFTMEYVAGGNLETFWQSHKSSLIPISDTMEIVKQVCTGLAVAHAEQPPVVHRDIKPQNILVGYDPGGLRIRIADFGLAKHVNPLTLLASAAGTPAFKPPEFVTNYDSCAGDVWAIGVTLYLLLTDRLPFPVLDLIDFSTGKCWSRPLIPASRFNVQANAQLDSILARALALKSLDRYPNAMTMLCDLTSWKAGETQDLSDRDSSADEHKSALHSQLRSGSPSAEKLLKNALELSHDTSRLMEAADLMEEALTNSPELREEYEYQLKLWRRGIML